MAAWVIFRCAPRDHWHHSVVIHVQERDLLVLLAEHEEDRVEELGELRQEVDVHASRDLFSIIEV